MSNWINHFANPWLLLLLLVVPFLLWRHRRAEKESPSVVYSDLSVARGLPKTMRQRYLAIVPYSRALVLSLGIVALARPQFGKLEMNTSSMGIDIAMVIDVSGSMMEEDYLPNRLEVAKTTAQNFVRLRQNDRISVVIFATTAALLCPPTFDMTAVEQFIGAIHRDIIASGSTAIGDGLALAVKHLKESEAKSRVVVLLTDGDNNAGVLSPEQAAEIAQALGIRVYTIGMTRGTARMNALGIFGNQAMSAQALGVSEEVLKDVAARTGGRYFRASSEQGLRQIYTEIDRLEKSEIEVRQTSDYDERFYLFWFPALALLGMEFLLKAFWLRRLP